MGVYGGYHGPLECIFSTTYSTDMQKAADIANIYFFQGGDDLWDHARIGIGTIRTALQQCAITDSGLSL